MSWPCMYLSSMAIHLFFYWGGWAWLFGCSISFLLLVLFGDFFGFRLFVLLGFFASVFFCFFAFCFSAFPSFCFVCFSAFCYFFFSFLFVYLFFRFFACLFFGAFLLFCVSAFDHLFFLLCFSVLRGLVAERRRKTPSQRPCTRN